MSATDFWPFFPQRRFSETLEWKTEVLQARAATQRVAYRAAPRLGCQASFLLEGSELARALAFCHKASHLAFKYPVWGDLSVVGALSSGATTIFMDTTAIDLQAGDEVVVWDDSATWEIATASTVNPSSIVLAAPLGRAYGRAIVGPVVSGRFTAVPEWSRLGRGLAKGRAAFVSTAGRDLALTGAYPVYRGFEVMTDRAVEVSAHKDQAERDALLVDNGVGPIQADAALDYARFSGVLAWSALGRDALWNTRRWLHARRGRQRGFWLPSWRADLVLADSIGAGDTVIKTHATGWPDCYGIRNIAILTTSGTLYFRRVLTATAGLPGQEDLTLDSALGVGLAPAQVRMICHLPFMRLDVDRVEIKRDAGLLADISVAVVEEPAP